MRTKSELTDMIFARLSREIRVEIDQCMDVINHFCDPFPANPDALKQYIKDHKDGKYSTDALTRAYEKTAELGEMQVLLSNIQNIFNRQRR